MSHAKGERLTDLCYAVFNSPQARQTGLVAEEEHLELTLLVSQQGAISGYKMFLLCMQKSLLFLR